jgi:hypothetical protein
MSHPDIYFAMQSLPDKEYATQGFLFNGCAGSGKTTFMKLMIQSVMRRMHEAENSRAWIYDFKSELYPFLYSTMEASSPGVPLYCVNPFDDRCAYWNIAEDVIRDSDAQQIASIFVPKEKGEKNVFFRNAAVNTVSNLLISFKRHSGRAWTLNDLFVALSDPDIYNPILARDLDTKAASLQTGSAETAANIQSTIRQVFERFRIIGALTERAKRRGHPSISLKHWVKNPGVLIANYDKTVSHVLEPFYRALYLTLMQHSLSLSDDANRRTWQFLDEFHSLEPLEGFPTYVTNSRSKGNCLVLGFQHILSLTNPDHYGPKALAFLGECKNKMFFKAGSFEHAEWCAKEYGRHEFIKFTEGTNKGKQRNSRETTYSEGVNKTADFNDAFLRMPAEFQALPLVSESGVFEAFSILQSSRKYCALSRDEATGPLWVPHPDHPGFIPVSTGDELFRPWSDDDFARLKISRSNKNVFERAMQLERPKI